VIEVSSQVLVSHAVSEKLNFGAKIAARAADAPVLRLASHEQQRIGAKITKWDVASRDLSNAEIGCAAWELDTRDRRQFRSSGLARPSLRNCRNPYFTGLECCFDSLAEAAHQGTAPAFFARSISIAKWRPMTTLDSNFN
jgi:hypothetical protein